MSTLNDVQPQVDAWLAQGELVALATVVKVWGSAPRQRGAKMAISASGGIAGSVSGGCVEAAVVDVAQEVLRTG
ncbi:MAG: XdhC family protein, partial [Thermomicrobiales bacterium]